MFQPTSPPETEQPAATSAQDVLNDVNRLQVPDSSLLEGYVLESTTLHEATQSACLEYRHPGANGDSVLLIAQGPIASAPPLEKIPDLPEYLSLQEAVTIGGAEKSSRVAGWKRSAWACSELAAQEHTPYSYALAPWLTWQFEGRQFDLYSASGGCATPGGMTHLDLLRVAESITGQSTHPADELDPDCLLSVAEAESWRVSTCRSLRPCRTRCAFTMPHSQRRLSPA